MGACARPRLDVCYCLTCGFLSLEVCACFSILVFGVGGSVPPFVAASFALIADLRRERSVCGVSSRPRLIRVRGACLPSALRVFGVGFRARGFLVIGVRFLPAAVGVIGVGFWPFGVCAACHYLLVIRCDFMSDLVPPHRTPVLTPFALNPSLGSGLAWEAGLWFFIG